MNYKTSCILEGLNSSLTQSVGKLWLCKVQQKSGARGTKRANRQNFGAGFAML